MKKKHLLTIILSVIASLSIFGVALAAYSSTITIVNTSATAYEMLGCNHTANVDYMAANGIFTSANGTDTRVMKGLAAQKHMLADDRIMFATPVPATSSGSLQFTTGSADLTYFPTIVGYDGYVTVADNTTLEMSDNFTWEVNGWWDTDNGTDKNAINKSTAFRLFASPTVAENITASIYETTSLELLPDGVGDYTDIDAEVPGASAHWSIVDESFTAPDDGNYVQTASNAQLKDAYTLQDASGTIPVDNIIHSVTVHFRFKKWVAGTGQAQPFLRLSGAETTGTEESRAWNGWGSYNELLAKPGGGDWTLANLDDLQVAIGIKSDNPNVVTCSQVSVVVSYSQPAASVTATGVESGEHTIKVFTDGEYLILYVN